MLPVTSGTIGVFITQSTFQVTFFLRVINKTPKASNTSHERPSRLAVTRLQAEPLWDEDVGGGVCEAAGGPHPGPVPAVHPAHFSHPAPAAGLQITWPDTAPAARGRAAPGPRTASRRASPPAGCCTTPGARRCAPHCQQARTCSQQQSCQRTFEKLHSAVKLHEGP